MPLDGARRAPTIAEAWSGGRNNFNLMRLVAAWLVIYGHAWPITGMSGRAAGTDVVTWLTGGYHYSGALAVDVFFVISGFLIAASLQRNDVRGYLIARAARIVPALAVCVLVCTFVLGPLLTAAPDYWRDPMTWRYAWLNISLWKSAFALPGVFTQLPQPVVNGSLWTLPIEAKLYIALLLASLCGLLRARLYPWLWALALCAAVTFSLWKAPLPDYLRDLLECTAFFITGTLFWILRDRVRLSPWPLLVLLVAAIAMRGHAGFWLPYSALLAGGTLYLALVPRLPTIRHTDLSYGLYLYGWPAAQLVQMGSPGGPWHNTLGATALALACAALSWFCVERPALRWKHRFVARAPDAAPVAGGA